MVACLAMEDLSDYRVGSQLEGATLEETELAIDELAKLHSAFWDRVDDLDWVPGIANSYHADARYGECREGGWDNMVRNFEVPDSVQQHRDRFMGRHAAASEDLEVFRYLPRA